MNITYADEDIENVWDEWVPLFHKHHEEIEDSFITEPLNPNKEAYINMGKRGDYHLITARADGKLVGYCGFFTYYHLHYKDSAYAMNDLTYLLPEYRVAWTGIKMLKAAEIILKRMKIQNVIWSARDKRDFSKILTRMGYHKQETAFMKVLE